ncbi:hypothetical protein TNCV_2508281 [Trichonephila clavipes]|nr:hypothetical protein TNCV_2508281 [Trichonephila clavipes]
MIVQKAPTSILYALGTKISRTTEISVPRSVLFPFSWENYEFSPDRSPLNFYYYLGFVSGLTCGLLTICYFIANVVSLEKESLIFKYLEHLSPAIGNVKIPVSNIHVPFIPQIMSVES